MGAGGARHTCPATLRVAPFHAQLGILLASPVAAAGFRTATIRCLRPAVPIRDMEAAMKGPFDLGGLSVVQLSKRVWSEMSDDGVWDAGAQLAYYFMLALFPLIIFLISLLSSSHAVNVVGAFLQMLRGAMPAQAFELLGGEVQ